MNHIIALSGKGNCGKSTTLNKVISLMKKKYKTLYYDDHCSDFIALFEVNGIRVGITAKGDKRSLIQDELKIINIESNATCDIFVCACRTYGETIDYINSLAKKYKAEITLIHKGDFIQSTNDLAGKRKAFNDAQAKMIVNEIIEKS